MFPESKQKQHVVNPCCLQIAKTGSYNIDGDPNSTPNDTQCSPVSTRFRADVQRHADGAQGVSVVDFGLRNHARHIAEKVGQNDAQHGM